MKRISSLKNWVNGKLDELLKIEVTILLKSIDQNSIHYKIEYNLDKNFRWNNGKCPSGWVSMEEFIIDIKRVINNEKSERSYYFQITYL